MCISNVADLRKYFKHGCYVKSFCKN